MKGAAAVLLVLLALCPCLHALKPQVSARTKRLFETVDTAGQASGAGGQSTLAGLERLDESWEVLRNGGWAVAPPQIVFEHTTSVAAAAATSGDVFDVAISGGTLGVFYAAALQKQGRKCVVVERGLVRGREQEWNIARNEIAALVRLGVMTAEQLESCVCVEFNPVRVGFNTDTSSEESKTFNLFTQDVLNLGVSPARLIALVKKNFEEMGGVVLEQAALTRIDVGPDCATLSLGGGGGGGGKEATSSAVRARLVLDCMGNGSPIAKQIRGPVEPDGICIVVGSCARGFDASNNTYSDLIFTDTPITNKEKSSMQYFWEAFPTGGGPTDRTTYLFTYLDAKPERPSVSEIFDDYWELLPRYQGKSAEELQLQRVLYGMFPTYRASPLATTLGRVLQVGDASGVQSPLSFGGFGSLTRHLGRICSAVGEALDGPEELLSADSLALINAYQPSLSAAWMFQRAMSVPVGRSPAPDLVVGTLSNSFSSMQRLGDPVMRPFLQDVLQFSALLKTLGLAAVQDPLTPFKIVPHVGVGAMLDFARHFANMGVFTLLHCALGQALVPALAEQPWLSPVRRFQLRRAAESWKFGSGLDYDDHE